MELGCSAERIRIDRGEVDNEGPREGGILMSQAQAVINPPFHWSSESRDLN